VSHLAALVPSGKVAGMRIILLAAVLAVGVGAGCSKSEKAATSEKAAKVATVTVDDVDKQLAAGECVPVDANGEQTRKKMGVVPGAVLLTDSDTFSVSELPADKSKTLVFYCANNHCGASHEAAGRALTAGYTNVKVMPEGIAGWVTAGKKVQNI
jgi:rhodanese-related sulfurtransferase